MCNLAGYAGNRRAAPVLLEMLRKQQAYNGGKSTGIATIHNGKIYMRKVVGNVDDLIRSTEARRLIEAGASVSSAANSCGFENLSYFSRTFKKHLHQLPSALLRKA